MMKKTIIIFTVILLIFSFSAGYASQKNFTDVKETDWYYNTLVSIVEKGIIDGYPDGTFKPQNNITKAEFTKVIIAALETEIVGGNSFVDTDEHWAKDIINTAVENQIIDRLEYGDNFNPNKNITRVEMAKMIVRALKLDEEAKKRQGEVTSFLDDLAITNADKGYVIIAAENEVIKGYQDRTFKPDGEATRAEAAQMLVNMLKVMDDREKKPEDVVERVNETLKNRDVDTKLLKGYKSVAVNKAPQTYEELIENQNSLEAHSYTGGKKSDWNMVDISQFVSNTNYDELAGSFVGVVKMELPNTKMEVSTGEFEGKVYNRLYCDKLLEDGFGAGIQIKAGEVIGWVSETSGYYGVGLEEEGNIYEADYIAFSKKANTFISSYKDYERILIVFDNPFKK